MPATKAPKPIAIEQQGGPDFAVVPEIVPYYTELLSDLAGKDMPEAPFIALAASAGGSTHQPEFNDPISNTARTARELAKADDMINTGFEVPIMGLDSFRWCAGISKAPHWANCRAS